MFEQYIKMDGFAIITGGSRGLGKAMALELAREGYDLVINYVSDSSTKLAHEVCRQAKEEFGVGAIAVQANVSEYEQCEKIVRTGIEAFGEKIAVLINNAGIQSNQMFYQMDPAHYQKLIGIELLGPMHLARLVLPYMMKAQDGCIINISSICCLFGQTLQCDYDAAKAGLIGFTRGLANEYAPYKIRVNCIAPGLIRTDMLRDSTEEQIEEFRQTIPFQRLGEPDDIARCMAYIVNATYLTGQTISPNGGSTMY